MKLYHASHHNNLEKLDPRSDDHLFATPYKPLAAMFLAPKGFDVEITKFGDEYALIVNSNAEEFITNDLGGTIYELLEEGFSTNDDLTMPGTEYITWESVAPTNREEYASAIEAMNQNAVRVYFVDQATIQKIRSAEDHGQSIIKSLNPFN